MAVGAPLEDDGQGSVYIFNGRRRGVNPEYSQVREGERERKRGRRRRRDRKREREMEMERERV